MKLFYVEIDNGEINVKFSPDLKEYVTLEELKEEIQGCCDTHIIPVANKVVKFIDKKIKEKVL